ncbi:MAG: hypothetical protein LBH01_10060 [Verrucomicrobiales bacterium]|jgi:hypothetical protein|nr:hypothetical protein [Verrucomicrobiales bacterium]
MNYYRKMAKYFPRKMRGLILHIWSRKPKLKRDAKRYKICIFKVENGIGDFVLALGTIQFLVKKYGESECLLIIPQEVAGLAKYHFPKVDVIDIPGCLISVWQNVIPSIPLLKPIFSTFQCEELFCFRHRREFYHELVLGWIHAQKAYAHPSILYRTADSMYHMVRLNWKSYKYDSAISFHPELVSSRAIAKWKGEVPAELFRHKCVLELGGHDGITIEQLLPKINYISERVIDELLICPFGSTPIRDIPVETLLKVLMELRERQYFGQYVLVGAAQRGDDLLAYKSKLENHRIKDVMTDSAKDLLGLYDMIASAKVILTTETSIAHIATAMNRPAVILLGGAQYGQFGPWKQSENQIWLTHKLPCFGCDWSCVLNRPECVQDISPDDILAAISKVLIANG